MPTFLPVTSTDAASVFIAWINLDFGIDTCFYDEIDVVAIVPCILFLLVRLIIHYLQRFANLLGNNPVSVLATLILLSHTKILCTLITVASLNIQTAIVRDGCGCIMLASTFLSS